MVWGGYRLFGLARPDSENNALKTSWKRNPSVRNTFLIPISAKPYANAHIHYIHIYMYADAHTYVYLYVVTTTARHAQLLSQSDYHPMFRAL